MLTKENFTLEHVMALKKSRTVDSFILERSIYAFGLLEALCKVGMPFIFKGGTSLINQIRSSDLKIVAVESAILMPTVYYSHAPESE